MKTRKSKLRVRIYLWLSPLLVLTIGLTLHQVYFARSVNRSIQLVADEEFQVAHVLKQTIQHLESVRLRVSADIAFADHLELLASDLDLLSALPSKNSTLPPRFPGILDRFEALLGILQQHQQKAARTGTDLARIEMLITQLLNDFASLSVQASEQLSISYQELRKAAVQSYVIMGVGSAIAVILAFAISTLISRRIASPIDDMHEITQQVALGNLEVRLSSEYGQEMQRLARSFNHMIERLRYYREVSDDRLLRLFEALQTILQRMPDPVFVVQEDLTVQFRNPRADAMLASQEFQDGFPASLLQMVRKGFSHSDSFIRRGLEEAVSFRVMGEERYFLVHTFPFQFINLERLDSDQTEPATLAVMLQDVTAMKLSDRLKTDLVATVSHELKTPITSARMALYLLLEEQIGSLNPEQRDLLVTARDDLERQLSMIDQLLSFTRFQSQPIESPRIPVMLPELLDQCVRNHSAIAKAAHISLATDYSDATPLTLTSDPEALSVVVNNLLGNAIKYSPAHSSVEITCQTVHRNIQICVADEGPGIPKDRIPTLFEPYTRACHPAHISGTGLGLHIAKNLVQSLGGQLWCESEPGKGSQFFVSLPSKPTTSLVSIPPPKV